ncbi:MAG: hypothetical protein IKX39_05980 [Muribaculaceae bacterium]|nr:hypothetical protein [Muribaculaceae bacterium]
MKKLIPIILLSVIAIVVACSHGTHQRQLVLVDSLISHSLTDSAYHIFKQIDRDGLGSEHDRMHYDLLQLMLSQGMSPDTYDFDTSRDIVAQRLIDYYRRTGNKRDLLLCHLYFGKILLLDQHNYNGASVYLKKAEELLPQVNDIRIDYLTNEALATLNYYSGNEELALDYSYKTLTCAKRGDVLEQSHAYNHLVVLYMARKEPDSVSKYCNRVISILDRMTPKNRSIALGNIGSVFLNNQQLDSAENYYQRAYDEYPLDYINEVRAVVYSRQGEPQKADSLWDLALQSPKLQDRAETYFYMLNEKYANNDYQGAADAAKQLLPLKDSLVQQMQTAEVQEIQLKYDKEVERRKLDRFMMWALVGALVLLALIAAGVIYHIRKANRAKEKMMRDQVLINDYQRQIEELERSGEDTSKDIQALRKKMDALQAQQTEKLSEGRELYQRIVAGESAVVWSKEQLQKFTEFYKVVNLPFMLQMEQDYMRLSPGNRFFLILQDMGMSDEQMTHILGVSDGALRTTRSRLRQKRSPAPQQ